MLFDGRHFRLHWLWPVLFLLGTVVAAITYTSACIKQETLLGGSSRVGLICGSVGGALILFEFALWPRKRFPFRRVFGSRWTWSHWRICGCFSAQAWMAAHIWLGLLTAPLILLHTGFRLGGPLPTVLTVVFALVIGSGMYGLWMQQTIPRKMLAQATHETIYTQIDRVAEQLAYEGDAILNASCLNQDGQKTGTGPTVEVVSVAVDYPTKAAQSATEEKQGVFRTWQSKTLEREIPIWNSGLPAELRDFFKDHLRPYLERGRPSGAALANSSRAEQLFDNLRRRFGKPAYTVIAALEELVRQRRDLDVQKRLHRWLHAWVPFHVALSAAMLILMFVHIYTALRYW